MARSPAKPGLLVRTLRRLGPPPLPPRRYYVKFGAYDARHRAGPGRHRDSGGRQRACA